MKLFKSLAFLAIVTLSLGSIVYAETYYAVCGYGPAYGNEKSYRGCLIITVYSDQAALAPCKSYSNLSEVGLYETYLEASNAISNDCEYYIR